MRLLQDPAYLSNTIARIYDCVLQPDHWEAVIAELASTIGAGRAFLGMATSGGAFDKVLVAHNQGPMDEVARYGPHNPVLPLGLVWPVDRAMVVSRTLGITALRATRYHREFLAPRGDKDAIGFVVTREGDRFGHWLLVTQEDRGLLAEDEAAGLELVAPHVRRALEISNALGVHQFAADISKAALDQLAATVLIVDGASMLAYANPPAMEAFAREDVLQIRNGKVRGATAAADAALRRAVLNGGGGPGGFEAAVTGTDGGEHLMFAVQLDSATRPADSTLLLLRSPREGSHNPVAIAARAFNLTQAQVQVLAFLAQGQSPDEIGQTLGVSMATVRTHLADLFRKTGTRGQPELVARVLSLASPLRGDAPGSRELPRHRA